jgi:hypothetical protein
MTDTLENCKNLLAGNAKFTVVHNESGTRFTYWFNTPKNGKNKGIIIARLLTGANNETDYSDIGTINPETGEVFLTGKIGTGETKNTLPDSIALLRWIAKLAADKQDCPEGITIHHAGKCLACGRTLTVPFPENPYRKVGLGPECGSK